MVSVTGHWHPSPVRRAPGNREKCLFDAVEYESEVEKQFARDLDNNANVKLFVKLPSWFKIDTPVGSYNPRLGFCDGAQREALFRA